MKPELSPQTQQQPTKLMPPGQLPHQGIRPSHHQSRRMSPASPGDPNWRGNPPPDIKYDGDPQNLGFFLSQVLTYMQEYGRNFPTQGARVRVVTLALEGAAARWMVTLHNADALEL